MNETTYDISSKKRETKKFPVADQDLQIRREGEGGHPDPEIRVGAVSKKIFLVRRASVWSTNKGRGAGPFPGSATGFWNLHIRAIYTRKNKTRPTQDAS